MRLLVLHIAFAIALALPHAWAAAPPWWTTTTVYQIYPRSFQDNDGDGIGDLPGIISRLDYLHDLGVQTLWISPFYPSPLQDWGYDISDYTAVAPEYGTLADLDTLIARAHALGMRIVLDLVLNHTSDAHPWFQASQAGDPAYKDFYIWQPGRGKRHRRPPNNWKAMGSNGWHRDTLRQEHYWAAFLPFQPDLNYRNPAVKAAIFDMVRFWLRRGVDGFRLDMFNSIYEDSLLRKNPFSLRAVPSEHNPNGFFQQVRHSMNQEESYAFATELRAVLDEFPGDRYLVGEVYGPPAQMKAFCMYQGRPGLHSVFLFETLSTPFTAKGYRELLVRFEEEFPAPLQPTYVFGNHDRLRSISRLGNDPRKAKLQALFQLTVRGIPFIYYGEEIGMPQARLPRKTARDPLAHRYRLLPTWLVRLAGESLNRDECRTPMQWTSAPHAGFCPDIVTPWLPITAPRTPDAPSIPNAADQSSDPHSLHATYRALLALRNSEPPLQAGTLALAPEYNTAQVLAYWRESPGRTLLILLNFSGKELNINIPKSDPVFSTHPGAYGATLRPWEGRIYEKPFPN